VVEAEQDVELALVADGEPAEAREPGQRALIRLLERLEAQHAETLARLTQVGAAP